MTHPNRLCVTSWHEGAPQLTCRDNASYSGVLSIRPCPIKVAMVPLTTSTALSPMAPPTTLCQYLPLTTAALPDSDTFWHFSQRSNDRDGIPPPI